MSANLPKDKAKSLLSIGFAPSPCIRTMTNRLALRPYSKTCQSQPEDILISPGLQIPALTDPATDPATTNFQTGIGDESEMSVRPSIY